MTGVVVLTTEPDFERRVRLALGSAINGDLAMLPVPGEPAGPGAAEMRPGDLPPRTELVVLGPGLATPAALALARRVDAERPEIAVVVVAEPSPALWEQALEAGVRAVVSPAASGSELHHAFERARQAAARRRGRMDDSPSASAGSGNRVVTVISPKGGSGKTTITSNLAVTLARTLPRQVVLVDADLQFGDVADTLGLRPTHTLEHVTATLDTLDPTGLKAFLTACDELFVLCAPTSPAEGERITPGQLEQIVDLLASEFRVVLLDTSAGLTEHTLSLIERSTDVLAVCSMDVPSVRALCKELEALDQVGMTAQARHIVLNRADTRVGLAPDDVEAALGVPLDVAVPSSRAVPLSVNQGIPLVNSDPHSPVTREIRRLAGRFGGDAPQGRVGWLSLLRRSA